MIRFALLLAFASSANAADAPAVELPGLADAIAYPFVNELVAAERADRVAWITTVKGVRWVWSAAGPSFRANLLSRAKSDDGEELTNLVLSADGTRALWVRGGDHDANWPADGKLQPNAASNTDQHRMAVWSASTAGGAPIIVGEGDAPTISAKGRVAFVRDGKVWSADAGGKDKPALMFFDRGEARSLAWSPDGTRLVFASRRGDHSFIGVFSGKDKPITWLSRSTGWDETPVWSPDGKRVAFTRRAGTGGPPEPMLNEDPHPWSILVADATTGRSVTVRASSHRLEGSFPEVADGASLMWAAGGRLTFRAELDG